MKLYIKYMVSNRCKALVQNELTTLGLQSEYVVVDLGVVEIHKDITDIQLERLKENLNKSGLEVLDNSKTNLIDKIKKTDNRNDQFAGRTTERELLCLYQRETWL
ncbi:hypothetical protein ABID22_004033 [Pontibacter aydingkolensis]|uniref:hypothetical protein n=1 Tax=Pontibacter aydingkolensis TaxID=1911536 RepID=UPI00293D39EE|nr:hypothetical protein [Pontibacter aydingkolensis]